MVAYCGNDPVIFQDSNGLCKEVGALLTKIDCANPNCAMSDMYDLKLSKTNTSSTSFAVMAGFNLNILGDGFQFTLNFVSTKENWGLQYTYYYSKDSEISKRGKTMLGVDIGPYAGIQITEKASMEDLTGYSKCTGGDCFGGLDFLTDEKGEYFGWQLGISSVSKNVHSLYTDTQTIFSVPTIDLPEIIVDWVMGG